MSKLGVKYDGCQEVIESLTRISNCTYLDLAEDLREVLNSLNSLKNKPSTEKISNVISKAEENTDKLRSFATGLQSYVEKLYEFDNTFYNNFVLLDGTNYDKYKSNISSINISDDHIKHLLREEDKKSVDALVVALMRVIKRDLASDPSIIKEIEKELKKFALSEDNNKALGFSLRGNYFKVEKSKGATYIRLSKRNLDTNDVKKCAEYLYEELGILTRNEFEGILNDKTTNSARQAKKLIDRVFTGKGVLLYEDGKWSKYANKLAKTEYIDLNKGIIGLKKGFPKTLFDNVKEAAKDDLFGEYKYIKDNYKNAVKSFEGSTVIKDVKKLKLTSKLEFAGKAVGVVDKAMTIHDNVNDNLKDEKGDWNVTADGLKECAVDTTVDLATSAGAAAAGAAIGSFIPVVGTVAGALIGAGIGIVINAEIVGEEPSKKSPVDVLKDISNAGVDKVGECMGKIFW